MVADEEEEEERRLRGDTWQQLDERREDERQREEEVEWPGRASEAAVEEDRSSRNSLQRRGEREKRRRQLVTVDLGNWRYYLGHKRHFLAYFNYFSQQLATLQSAYEQQQAQEGQRQQSRAQYEGAAEVQQVNGVALSVSERYAVRELLAQYAPVLLPGGSHSALHPLIHTGWSLACGRAGLSTLCEGLAYLCYSYHCLDPSDGGDSSSAQPPSVDTPNSHSLFAALQSTVSACRDQRLLSAMEAGVLCVPYCEMDLCGAFQRKLVWLSVRQARLLHRLSCLPALPSPELSVSVLPSLFLHTLFLFAVSGDDFFVLHCLTSLYALSLLLYELPTHYQPTALRYGVKFILASWIAQGLPGVEDEVWSRADRDGGIEQAVLWLLERAESGDERIERAGGRRLYQEVSWEELRAAGVESDDEHSQKLVCQPLIPLISVITALSLPVAHTCHDCCVCVCVYVCVCMCVYVLSGSRVLGAQWQF